MGVSGQKPFLEINTTVGFGLTTLSGGDLDGTIFNVPSPGIQGAPTIAATFFVRDKVALEPQFYFAKSSSDGFDITSVALGGNAMYLIEGAERNSAYFTGQSAFLHSSVEDFDDDTDFALGGGFGYRALVRDILAVRLEGAYRRWFDLETNEFSFRVGIGAVLPAKN